MAHCDVQTIRPATLYQRAWRYHINTLDWNPERTRIIKTVWPVQVPFPKPDTGHVIERGHHAQQFVPDRSSMVRLGTHAGLLTARLQSICSHRSIIAADLLPARAVTTFRAGLNHVLGVSFFMCCCAGQKCSSP